MWGGSGAERAKSDFVAQAKAERQQREQQRAQEERDAQCAKAVVRIQAHVCMDRVRVCERGTFGTH